MRALIPILFAATLFCRCDDGVSTTDLVIGSWQVQDVTIQSEVFICYQSLKGCIVNAGYSEQQAQFIIAQHLQQVLIVNTFSSIDFNSDGTWIGKGAKEIKGGWRLGPGPTKKIIVTSDSIPGFEESALISYLTASDLHLVDGFTGTAGSKSTYFQVELSLQK